MRELILRQFFEGTSSARELASDLLGSTRQSGSKIKITSIEDMDAQFRVTSEMAVRLCDAVLAGEIPAESLETVGFALQTSDKFEWDGDEDEALASVIADWSCPEVNYPLTIDNVRRFREWLLRSEPYPTNSNVPGLGGGNIITVTEKESSQPIWKKGTAENVTQSAPTPAVIFGFVRIHHR